MPDVCPTVRLMFPAVLPVSRRRPPSDSWPDPGLSACVTGGMPPGSERPGPRFAGEGIRIADTTEGPVFPMPAATTGVLSG
ncbi:hypothetical protein JCM14469_16030 [Desulfatiferula olefinivorans]